MFLIKLSLGTSAGFYTYVEASVGNSFDLATFVGPVIKQSAATCKMTFWYHMYGSSIGELSVHVVHGYRMTKRWSLGSDQGKKLLIEIQCGSMKLRHGYTSIHPSFLSYAE